MNQFFSLLAAAFVFTAASASAATTVSNDQLNDALTTQTVAKSVTLYAAVEKPNGEIATLTARYGSMSQALVGFHQFVSRMPVGSKLLRAEFVDENGNLIYAAQV